MGFINNLFICRDARTAQLTRGVGGRLFSRIMKEYVSKPDYEAAARYLGMLGENQVIVLENDSDINILHDFLMNDYRENPKSPSCIN